MWCVTQFLWAAHHTFYNIFQVLFLPTTINLTGYSVKLGILLHLDFVGSPHHTCFFFFFFFFEKLLETLKNLMHHGKQQLFWYFFVKFPWPFILFHRCWLKVLLFEFLKKMFSAVFAREVNVIEEICSILICVFYIIAV